jgi:hypothetical protein
MSKGQNLELPGSHAVVEPIPDVRQEQSSSRDESLVGRGCADSGLERHQGGGAGESFPNRVRPRWAVLGPPRVGGLDLLDGIELEDYRSL